MNDPLHASSAPPLPAAHGSKWGGWLAALVIAVSLVVAMWQVVEDKASVPAGDSGGNAQLQAEVGARYLVGMNAVLGPMLEQTGQSKDSWLAPFEAAAHSPRQRLELEIVRREVMGEPVSAAVMPEAATPDDQRDWRTWAQLTDGAEPSDEDQKRFDERYGWFARLAASHGKPDDDPARAAVLGQARRTFIGSAVLMIGAVLAILTGCGLAILVLAMWACGQVVWRFARHDHPVVITTGGSVWLEVFAVYLGFMVLGGLAANILPREWAPWPQAAAFLGAAGFGWWWPAYRGLNRAERRAGFGWHRGQGMGREMVAGVAGYLAGLPILAIGIVLTAVLTLMAKADASHPLNHMTGVSGPVLAFLGVLAAVWAPVVEETFFRGAFYSAWRQRCGPLISSLGTGVIFAAVHPQGWTAIPALGAIGCVFAILREWRGSLIAPITAHALNNGTLFLMMIVIMR